MFPFSKRKSYKDETKLKGLHISECVSGVSESSFS